MPTNSLMISKKIAVFTPDESLIIQKKYASKKFKFLSDVDQIKAAKSLLLKIHVITGWTLPTSDILNILIDQFYKKMCEEYSELNLDEIEYAFRKKGTTLEDWGKEINLNLIDKVFISYLAARYEVSVKEERLLPAPERKPWSSEDIVNQYRFDIETAFQAMKKNYQPIIHIYFEETLRADGMMKEEENINDFFARKLDSGCDNLYVKE